MNEIPRPQVSVGEPAHGDEEEVEDGAARVLTLDVPAMADPRSRENEQAGRGRRLLAAAQHRELSSEEAVGLSESKMRRLRIASETNHTSEDDVAEDDEVEDDEAEDDETDEGHSRRTAVLELSSRPSPQKASLQELASDLESALLEVKRAAEEIERLKMEAAELRRANEELTAEKERQGAEMRRANKELTAEKESQGAEMMAAQWLASLESPELAVLVLLRVCTHSQKSIV